MTKIRRPIRQTIMIGIALFAICLCVCLIGAQYISTRQAMYGQFQLRLGSILNYAQEHIDADDLEACIRSGKESAAYAEMQKDLDEIKDSSGVHYLYVIIPLNTNPTDNIRNVIAAVSKEEYATLKPEELASLNGLSGTDYSPETAEKYLKAYEGGEQTFFENRTVFGHDYTAARVLRNSRGEKFALLCADDEVERIDRHLRENMLNVVAIVVFLALLFAVAFILWADRNIATPIRQLEESVAHLEEKSRDPRNPDSLTINIPEIHTGNEVESLAAALQRMNSETVEAMKTLMKQGSEASRLSALSNRDALTRVGTRVAWEKYVDGMKLKISEEKLDFSLVLMDTQGLKWINEQHGRDKGDLYLQKACRIFCEVFRHSPVFRIDGDLFIAVLTGGDRENRETLISGLKNSFAESQAEPNAAPWEQIHAAVALEDWRRETDHAFEDVYGRLIRQLRTAKKEG